MKIKIWLGVRHAFWSELMENMKMMENEEKKNSIAEHFVRDPNTEST